jgi:hypothetical protein
VSSTLRYSKTSQTHLSPPPTADAKPNRRPWTSSSTPSSMAAGGSRSAPPHPGSLPRRPILVAPSSDHRCSALGEPRVVPRTHSPKLLPNGAAPTFFLPSLARAPPNHRDLKLVPVCIAPRRYRFLGLLGKMGSPLDHLLEAVAYRYSRLS